MRFYSFIMKNVGRRRVRSMLTITGMAIAVGAVVALVGISKGFEESFLAIYKKGNVDMIVQRSGTKQRLSSAVPQALGEKIEAIPGVDHVNTGLVDLISIENSGPVGVLIQGWIPGSQVMQKLTIVEGRMLTNDDGEVAMLGEGLANKLEKKVGDDITIFEGYKPFKVMALFRGTSVYEDGSIIVPLKTLQHLMGKDGQVNGFTVVLKRPGDNAEIERVAAEISKLSPLVEVIPTQRFVESTSELQLVRGMSWVTSVIALIIGAVGMLNTMVMSVFERTKEIGILRAIGWRKQRVMRMILLESLVLSITGGVVGTTGAVLLTRLLGSLPWASGMVAKEIPNVVIVQGFAIAILIGVLGAIYPAYRGANLLPTEALRHE